MSAGPSCRGPGCAMLVLLLRFPRWGIDPLRTQLERGSCGSALVMIEDHTMHRAHSCHC